MLFSSQYLRKVKIMCCLMMIMAIGSASNHAEDMANSMSNNMVSVKGGSFEMGDVFGEGLDNERPVHEVALSDFYISKYEVYLYDTSDAADSAGYLKEADNDGINDIGDGKNDWREFIGDWIQDICRRPQ